MKTNKQNKTNSQNIGSTNLVSELKNRTEQLSEKETAAVNYFEQNSELRTQHSELAEPGPWRGVFFDGPQPDQDHEGEEIPVWLVYVGDEEAEPTGTVYHLYNFARAQVLAQRMSTDRRLELINEATTA